MLADTSIYTSPPRSPVKQHVVAQLTQNLTAELFMRSSGIGRFLEAAEIRGFVNARSPLCRFEEEVFAFDMREICKHPVL